jgi:hypothetical protein
MESSESQSGVGEARAVAALSNRQRILVLESHLQLLEVMG